MATEKDLIDCMASYQWDQLNEQLAAKDREIAELRRQLAEAVEMCARTQNEGMDSLRARWAAERERDEARECVGRLYSAAIDVMAIAGRDTLPFNTLRAALAATPEHLRNA